MSKRNDKNMEIECSKYYYMNDDMVTVCLLTNKRNKVIARGLAICSPTDPVDKKEGRFWARRRALRALLRRTRDTFINRPEAKEVMAGIGFGKKTYVNPKLTKLEQQLLPYI